VPFLFSEVFYSISVNGFFMIGRMATLKWLMSGFLFSVSVSQHAYLNGEVNVVKKIQLCQYIYGAFMCCGNYDKYQKPMWKMHMNTPSCCIFHWATRRIYELPRWDNIWPFQNDRVTLELWMVKICTIHDLENIQHISYRLSFDKSFSCWWLKQSKIVLAK